MRCLILLFVLAFLTGCNSDENIKNKLLNNLDSELSGNLDFIYPKDGTVFPPEFPSPTISWADHNRKSTQWLINIRVNQSENIYTAFVSERTWKPNPEIWKNIKKNSTESPAVISIIGINSKNDKEILSGNQINIKTSVDSVGAPIFYRAVPLPFSFATSHLDSIKYMLGDISSSEKPKVLLDKLPVCGNCHSFTPDGRKFAMDVDAFGDKGSYLIADVEDEVVMTPEKFISWSDFQKKSTMALLSQISPNGKYVLSTLDDNEIFESRDELEYSQLFFPIKGILTTYDIEKNKYSALPGADDTTYVQSNSSWTPDSKHVYFARAKAVQRKESGMTYGTGISDLNKFQVLRDSFLQGDKEFKFNLMKIPFNNGKGGKPVAIKGASKNNKSNYFPKVSPDGKWMVFCKANNYMLLQPDSKLYIMSTEGGEPRLMNCNTNNMNSWHSWSPNGRWMVFSSKSMGPYTQLFLTHIDENGIDSPPVWLENLKVKDRAANIPEFINVEFNQFNKIVDDFSQIADYNVRGTSKAQFGDFKEAIVDFNKALQVNANDDQAFANRGKAKDELGDLEGALKDLTRAIELKPEEYDYYVQRSNVKVKKNDFDGAISDCSKAIDIKSSDAPLHAHRATIYQLAQKYENALSDFSKAISIRPDYALYYVHRANIYFQMKKQKLALADYNQAVRTESSNVHFLLYRGIFKNETGDSKGAISDFGKAISINPNFPDAYLQMAAISEKSKNWSVAIKSYSKAIEFTKTQNTNRLARLHNNRGVVYGQLNDFGNAIADFDQAIGFKNDFVDAYCNRAFAKFNSGQINDAKVDCDLALQINPGNKKALTIKEMIWKKK